MEMYRRKRGFCLLMKRVLSVIGFVFLFVLPSGCTLGTAVNFDETNSEKKVYQGDKGAVAEQGLEEEARVQSDRSDHEPIPVGDEMLPIGTVVKVQSINQPLMIYGRVQKQGGTEKIWDYVAVPYPQGNISDDSNIFFNHDFITEVLHKGLETDEEIELREYLEEVSI